MQNQISLKAVYTKYCSKGLIKIIRKFHKQQLTKFSKDVVSSTTGNKKNLKSGWDTDNLLWKQSSWGKSSLGNYC